MKATLADTKRVGRAFLDNDRYTAYSPRRFDVACRVACPIGINTASGDGFPATLYGHQTENLKLACEIEHQVGILDAGPEHSLDRRMVSVSTVATK